MLINDFFLGGILEIGRYDLLKLCDVVGVIAGIFWCLIAGP